MKTGISRASNGPSPALRQRLVWIILLAGALLLGAPSASAQSAWAELWLHRTQAPVSAAAVGDVTGDGLPELVAIVGDEVSLYALDDEGPRRLGVVAGYAEPPTAVAVADYDGDGRGEVWIGTAAPGVTYVFRFDPVALEFQRVDRARYAWSGVRSVAPLNLDGWGRLDVAVLEASGRLRLFRWTREGYVEAPAREAMEDVKFFAAEDVDGDDLDDLIIARGVDEVVVVQWRHTEPVLAARQGVQEYLEALDRHVLEEGNGRWEREWHRERPPAPFRSDLGAGTPEVVWENFVWGTHSGLFVGDFEGGPLPEIAIPSSQRLLKLFTYREGEGLELARTPTDWPQPAFQFIGIADLDGNGRQQAVEAWAGGIAGWSLSPVAERDVLVQTRLQPVTALFPVADGAILSGPWGFSRLKRVPLNYVRVLHEGAPYTPERPALVEGERVFLAYEDWSRVTGMTLRFDPDAGLVTGIRGFHFLLGRIGDPLWVYDGRSFDVDGMARIQSETLYLSAEFARAIGVEVLWEPYSRTLVIDP